MCNRFELECMEDKALRGDQFASKLLNYMGSCWTGVENTAVRMKPCRPSEKRRGEERNADMEFCRYGKDITLRDSSSIFVK